MAKRHIKFYKYYKEWVETYKIGQVRDVTLNKYWLVARQIQKLAPELDLGDITRMDVQHLINRYGETHELPTVRDFLHHIEAPLRDAKEAYFIRNDTDNWLGFSEIIKLPHTDAVRNELGISRWVKEFK